MTEEHISNGESQHQDFWKHLKDGYDYFQNSPLVPSIKADNQDKYLW